MTAPTGDVPSSDLNALLALLHKAPSDATLHRQRLDAFRDLDDREPACLDDYQSVIAELLGILFQGDTVKHQHLGPLAVSQVRLKYHIDADTYPAVDDSSLSLLAEDTLFLATLARTVNVERDFEPFFGQIETLSPVGLPGHAACARGAAATRRGSGATVFQQRIHLARRGRRTSGGCRDTGGGRSTDLGCVQG